MSPLKIGAAATGKNADDGSVFVAIPKRSWQPLKATVETKTTIKLG